MTLRAAPPRSYGWLNRAHAATEPGSNRSQKETDRAKQRSCGCCLCRSVGDLRRSLLSLLCRLTILLLILSNLRPSLLDGYVLRLGNSLSGLFTCFLGLLRPTGQRCSNRRHRSIAQACCLTSCGGSHCFLNRRKGVFPSRLGGCLSCSLSGGTCDTAEGAESTANETPDGGGQQIKYHERRYRP